MSNVSSSLILLLWIMNISSCSNPMTGIPERQRIDEYFQSAGVVDYFLPELPDWANFSTVASCKRSKVIKYFDHKILTESFNYSYPDVVYFQLLFNKDYQTTIENYQLNGIPMQEEERIFHLTRDRIEAGFHHPLIPTYNKVNILWIDSFVANEKVDEVELKKFTERESFNTGQPVWLSLCFTHNELEALSAKLRLFQVKLISADMFSPYDEKNKQIPGFKLHLDLLFQHKPQIQLYLKKGQDLPDISGVTKKHYF